MNKELHIELDRRIERAGERLNYWIVFPTFEVDCMAQMAWIMYWIEMREHFE